MRKIVLNIFVVLFILCFVSQKSFAKCGKFDFYCKRTGKQFVTSEKNSVEKSRKDTDIRAKIASDETNTEFNIFCGHV